MPKKTSTKKAGAKTASAKPASATKGPAAKAPAAAKAKGTPSQKAAAKAAAAKAAATKAAATKAPAKRGASSSATTSTAREDVAEALLAAMTIAMIADGVIADSEHASLLRFASEPMFRGIDVEALVDATIERCLGEGPGPVLEDVTAKLRTTHEREAALESCVAIVASDGRVTASEARMLRALCEALQIPIARAKVLAGPVAAALG